MKSFCVAASVSLFLMLSGCGQDERESVGGGSFTVTSPGGNVTVDLNHGRGETALTCSVLLGDRIVIEDSPMGIVLDGEDGDFVNDLSFVDERRRSQQELYEMPSGKKSNHINNYKELVLSFVNGSGRSIELEIRVYDDGMGYRYRFPGEGEVTVLSEASGFKVPTGSNMWAALYAYDYEQMFEHGVVGTDFLPGQFGRGGSHELEKYGQTDHIAFPVLYETPAHDWVLLSEASVYDQYCGCHLAGDRRNEGLFEIVFYQDDPVTSLLPLETPWRVAIAGETLSPIVASVLVDNLNPPNELGDDIDWIRPGKSINTWMTATPQEKRPVFEKWAEGLGWEYHGGPGGPIWSGVDMRDYLHLPFDEQTEKVRELIEEDSARGVVKFFCDYVNGDSQEHMRFCDLVVRICAEHKMNVVFHGATLPRGQRRRFPNIIGVEAVRGEEWYKEFSTYYPTPEHFCTLPFSRNVIGPMDITGVCFDGPLDRPQRKLTNAAELATSLLFETGIQHWGTTPWYAKRYPPIMDFLAKVPVIFDTTSYVDGYPGEYACLARRKGPIWYIGAITAGDARTLKVPLKFLMPEYTYDMTLYSDGDDIDDFDTEKARVTRETVLTINTLKHGGFCGYFVLSQDQ